MKYYSSFDVFPQPFKIAKAIHSSGQEGQKQGWFGLSTCIAKPWTRWSLRELAVLLVRSQSNLMRCLFSEAPRRPSATEGTPLVCVPEAGSMGQSRPRWWAH